MRKTSTLFNKKANKHPFILCHCPVSEHNQLLISLHLSCVEMATVHISCSTAQVCCVLTASWWAAFHPSNCSVCYWFKGLCVFRSALAPRLSLCPVKMTTLISAEGDRVPEHNPRWAEKRGKSGPSTGGRLIWQSPKCYKRLKTMPLFFPLLFGAKYISIWINVLMYS